MANKDLHIKPFDSGTIAKLEIFEDYAQAWIPTFVMRGDSHIHIFDFFSGPGYDCNNVAGSPIRLLSKINEQLGNILNKGTKIIVHLNEFEPKKKIQNKFNLLQKNCETFLQEHSKFKYFLTVKYYNKDAAELFDELLPIIAKYPSLVYLDQNGIKFISPAYLNQLEKLRTTDFLFFVSSSYFKRYGNTPEFQQVLKFKPEELRKAAHTNMHKVVLEKLKSNLSERSQLKLFPYSIKKGTNIFGIIFGATHYRAVDKFLSIGWRKNEINGEADYDIDEDISKSQLEMFGSRKLTKIEKFRNELESHITKGTITNNKEALLFTYETGNYYRYANELLKDLKKQKKVFYEGSTPGISYDNVFNKKKQRVVSYRLKPN